MNLVTPRAIWTDYGVDWPKLGVGPCVALILLLLCSSVEAVYIEYRVRDQFIHLEHAKQQYRQLQMTHRALLLEQGALLSPMRLVQIAKQKHMILASSLHQ